MVNEELGAYDSLTAACAAVPGRLGLPNGPGWAGKSRTGPVRAR